MQIVFLLALFAFAFAGLFHGLRVRRTSFLAGTYLPRIESDRHTGGWLEWFFMKHPSLCNVLDGISDLLPGPDSHVSDTVTSSTTFTRLQSRTLLHRYYCWQIHSLLRVILSLLFCGVLLALLPVGLTQSTHKLIAGGSVLLFGYAVLSWWRMRIENQATRKVCMTDRDSNAGDMVLGAFTELSRSACRQAVAFAFVFGLNMLIQIVVLIDVDNRLSLNGGAPTIQKLELPALLDPGGLKG